MVKVLHVIGSLDARMGGSVRAPLDVCAALVDRGHEAMIVASTSEEDDLAYLGTDYAHVPTRLFPRRFPRHNFHAPALRPWARQHLHDFDLVEIHGIFTFPAIDVAAACRRLRVPYLVRPHGQLDPYDLRKHTKAKTLLGKAVFKPMLDGCEALSLTTDVESQRLVTFGSKPDRVVVPLPVRTNPEPGDGASFRQRHGIPEEALVVLFLGRFDHKKGLQFLVPAIEELRAQRPELFLLVAGDGTAAERDQVDKALAGPVDEGWAVNVGFLDDRQKRSAYAASNVFALPSLNENFGIVVVEAMTAGLPLLLSSEVYIHHVPAADGAAIICRPDRDSCRQGLSSLLTADLETMGEASRRSAAEHFSITASTELLESVYLDVLAR